MFGKRFLPILLLLQLVNGFLPQESASSRTVIGSTSTSEERTCPFSRLYPRYRIDLTNTKKNEKLRRGGGFEIPFVTSWSFASVRRNLEKEFGAEAVDWVTEDVSGLSVFARLWRTAASLCDESLNKERIMAFINTDSDIILHWADIFAWLKKELPEDESQLLDSSFSFVDEVPVLHLKPNHYINSTTKKPSMAGLSANKRILTERTKSWVQRILVDQGICPFTKSTTMSGHGLLDLDVPIGSIAYHSSFSSTSQVCHLMADTLEAIEEMIQRGPEGRQGVSSILLAAPEFDDDFALWSGPIFCILEASVVAAQAETMVGVVCFHPQYQTPDGSSWPGFGHMHSVPRLKTWLLEGEPDCQLSDCEIAAGGAWQRRTPHATVNVLRADQLEKAEGRRATEELYRENILKLVGESGVGLDRLRDELHKEREIK